MSIRVLWIALEWPRVGEHAGGVGRYEYRLAERLRELVELHVIAFEGHEPMSGVAFHPIPAPRGRFDRYYLSAWRAAKVARSLNPDVIHAHGDDFLLRSTTPRVRTFYGSSTSEARTSKGLRKLNHYLLGWLEKVAARRSKIRIAISPEQVDEFDCQFLVPPFLQVAVSRTSTSSVAPAQGVNDYVIFVGSHSSRKRGYMVERAVDHLRQSGWNVGLHVVGPSHDAPNWSDWVRHMSGLTDVEVASEIERSILLAAPSSYEGFGIPTLEALELERPVVASPNPGSLYLAGMGGENVPLMVMDDERFPQAIEEVVRNKGMLDVAQRTAARSLVSQVRSLGSPGRIVEIYKSIYD